MHKLAAMRRCVAIFVLLVAFGCGVKSPEANPSISPSINGTDNMPPRLAASGVTKETLNVGVETVVQSDSPFGRYQAVFEDDGDTGYFYALDTEKTDNPIIDALHIYNVQSVKDKDKPSQLHIVWSLDGTKAALFINSYPHAVYNFSDGIGCCRTGFPPPIDHSASHEWDETQMKHFHANDGS